MAVRIREDGTIVCAAMHPPEPGDTYVDDSLHYTLSAEAKVLVTEPMHSTEGRGGHARHGQWWWRDDVPADVVLERRP